MKKILFVIGLCLPLPLLSQDTTRRTLPTVESMLEDAGENRMGASVFLDEIEYYSSHPQRSEAHDAPDPFGMLSASPFMRNLAPAVGDSSGVSYAGTPGVFGFPLTSEESGSLFNRMRVTIRSTIENSFTERRGRRDGKWSGSPVHSVQRIQLSALPIAAGFLLEHDEGEQFANGHAVGYVSVTDQGVLRQGVGGMFTVNSGEGLVLGRSSLFSKGTISITQTKKYGAELVPYLSREEFHYFRGAAASIDIAGMSFTGFASHRALPATVDESGTVTSFFTSGYFRSESEIGKIHAVTEKSAGFIASASPASFATINVAAIAAAYDRPMAVSIPYAFGGGHTRSAGASFTLKQSTISAFGEAAGHDARSLSGVLGVIYRATRDFAFAVHCRSYSDQYNNPFAHAFGERGCANGERGLYFGFDWNVSRVFGLFSYVDLFSVTDPELFTKEGEEYLLRADGLTAKNFSYSAQLKYKTRASISSTEDDASDIIDNHRESTLRLMLRYTSPGGYVLTQRCNVTRVSYAVSSRREKGILLSTDAAKRWNAIGLGVKTGAVFFDTDSYDSGLSMYEPGVRGMASTSILFGQGVRLFLMADYTPVRSAQLSLKYSIVSKWNESTLGSGDDELLGNTDPEMTFQAEIAL